MAVQAIANLITEPFIQSGEARKKTVTLAQDAGRSGNIVAYTVMAQYVSGASAGKWVTLTDVTATDGSQYPRGISLRTVTEAAVQAGDITEFDILYTGEFSFDQGKLTLENSLTLDTEITSPAGIDTTIRHELDKLGMHPVQTTSTDAYENA